MLISGLSFLRCLALEIVEAAETDDENRLSTILADMCLLNVAKHCSPSASVKENRTLKLIGCADCNKPSPKKMIFHEVKVTR